MKKIFLRPSNIFQVLRMIFEIVHSWLGAWTCTLNILIGFFFCSSIFHQFFRNWYFSAQFAQSKTKQFGRNVNHHYMRKKKTSSGKAANLSLQRRLFEPQRIVPTAHRRCLLDCIPHLFSPFPLSTTLVFRTPRSHVPPKTDTQCHALDRRRRRRRRPRVLPLKYSSSDGGVVRRPRDGQLTSCGENLA